MRAFGGAITSPCSNDSESRRPTPTIFELPPPLLINRWMLLGLANTDNGTLWETADHVSVCYLACNSCHFTTE